MGDMRTFSHIIASSARSCGALAPLYSLAAWAVASPRLQEHATRGPTSFCVHDLHIFCYDESNVSISLDFLRGEHRQLPRRIRCWRIRRCGDRQRTCMRVKEASSGHGRMDEVVGHDRCNAAGAPSFETDVWCCIVQCSFVSC